VTLARAGLPAGAVQGLGARFAALSRPRRWAALATLLWLVVVLAYGMGFWNAVDAARGMRFLDAMFFLMALVLPALLFWLAAWLAEELARQREIVAALAEVTAPLVVALASTREALAAHNPSSPEDIGHAVKSAVVAARPPDPGPQIDRILAAQARLEVAIMRLAAKAPPPEPEPAPATAAPPAAAPPPAAPPAPGPARPEPPVEAPGLPLLAEPELPARPDWPGLVRALDFPRDADDAEGFRALKAALRHHGLAQMLQAAEDVLTLLAQEGVYVDELPMQPVDPAAWRRFIAGTRGPEVAAAGSILDLSALERTRGLMKSDTIFRDTALFFQRRFDSVLTEFATEASDAELAELAGTRCGRAFMLLARLSGSLD
jgi:hypothetical protein